MIVRQSNRWARARILLPMLFALALPWQPGQSARAQTEDLPEAEKILDNYIKVTGGRAAYEKLKSRMMKGTLDLPSQGIKGTLTIYQAAPDKMHVTVEFPGLGISEEGYADGVAWETNPMTGPRLKEGGELAEAKLSAQFHAELEWRKYVKEAKTLGVADIDGKPAYKVEITPTAGNQRITYYDKESGLEVAVETSLTTPGGDVPIEARISDYKEVDGIRMPHKIVRKIAVQEVNIAWEEIKHNFDIPEGKFELPADVKLLLERSKKADEVDDR